MKFDIGQDLLNRTTGETFVRSIVTISSSVQQFLHSNVSKFQSLPDFHRFQILFLRQKIQSLTTDNVLMQQEQERLTDLQAKLINESKKREQDIKKQVCLRY